MPSSSLLLLSLLAIASAADYVPQPADSIFPSTPISQTVNPQHGYLPKPEFELPKPSESFDPKPNSGYGSNPKPDSDYVKSDTEYAHKSKPDNTIKPDHTYNPEPNSEEIDKPEDRYSPKPYSDKPGYEYSLKPENPLQIGVEGLVLCKSGSKYVPVEGAVARITCSALDKNGYETTPFSCLTSATDAKGYFFKTLSLLGIADNLKLRDCKVKLEKSPLETCNIPTDVNKGITGAVFSSYRILHEKKIKLYSVGPFFYTREPKPTPSGY